MILRELRWWGREVGRGMHKQLILCSDIAQLILHVMSISTGCYVSMKEVVLSGGEGCLWKPAREEIRCSICRKQLWQVSESTRSWELQEIWVFWQAEC